MKIAKGIKLDTIEKHMAAMWIVQTVMQDTAQQFNLLEASDKSFKIGIRVNLQSVQVERLIIKPLNDLLDGYTINADLNAKTLEISKRVSQSRKAKSAEDNESTAD